MRVNHLDRVSKRIEPYVFRFCLEHTEFRMDQLTKWVAEKVSGLAPDSPGRILRSLKKQGKVDYEVVDRRGSLYRIKQIEAQGVLF